MAVNGKVLKAIEITLLLAVIVIGLLASHYTLAGDVRVNAVKITANTGHIRQFTTMQKDIAEIKRDVAVIKDRMERNEP